jgi:hypothetical protein
MKYVGESNPQIAFPDLGSFGGVQGNNLRERIYIQYLISVFFVSTTVGIHI